jgi:hypothetical protein
VRLRGWRGGIEAEGFFANEFTSGRIVLRARRYVTGPEWVGESGWRCRANTNLRRRKAAPQMGHPGFVALGGNTGISPLRCASVEMTFCGGMERDDVCGGWITGD